MKYKSESLKKQSNNTVFEDFLCDWRNSIKQVLISQFKKIFNKMTAYR